MALHRSGILAIAAAAALALGACSSPAAAPSAAPTTAAAATSVSVTDNKGTHTVPVPPKSVVALDNRTFQTLYDWDVKLTGAPRALMPDTVGYAKDQSIPDIGTHGEPKLELIVAAEPDLIINGQRFSGKFDEIAALTPDAVQLLLDPREGQPFADELKRQTTELGKVFGKDAEAKKLADDFDASIKAVKDAYKPEQTVVGVITSGGKIGYSAPSVGRTLGPLFDIFGLTPAIKIEGASTDHQGDDINEEAIRDANPDWILVMDRDAAISADDPAFVPGARVLQDSVLLKDVTAITKGQVVYMPTDTYINEGIQTYTKFFNDMAKAMAAAK